METVAVLKHMCAAHAGIQYFCPVTRALVEAVDRFVVVGIVLALVLVLKQNCLCDQRRLCHSS